MQYKFSTIAPENIKIGKRFRKNVGDLTQLQESIEKEGLLHPVVINSKNELIAGFRRLKSWLKLKSKNPKKYDRIPAHVFDMDDPLVGELHENTLRKDFDIEEVVAIKQALEKQIKRGRPSKDEEPKGSAREIVADITGKSTRQINKMEAIVEHAKESKKNKEVLEKVKSGKLSVDSAHKIVTREERNLPKVPLPDGEYDVIYVDPPLQFDNRNIRGSADHHYPTMTIDEICNLQIPAAKNAILFLWMPSSMFFDEQYLTDFSNATYADKQGSTLQLILSAWRFKPKTFFVWKKDKIGTGSWLRNQHENLIIAIKGEMPTPAKLFSSIIEATRTEHSAKPDVVYDIIEKMYPKRKYLELFARKSREGWKSHGNQVTVMGLDSARKTDKITGGSDSVEILEPIEDESPITKLRSRKK